MSDDQKIINEIESIRWWHQIELPMPSGKTIVTPGEVDHCNEQLATYRFGIPKDLKGKTILDIGCWDGYFSFLAEKRGADLVYSIDPYQVFENPEEGQRGYKLAHKLLNSKCIQMVSSLESYAQDSTNSSMDIVLYLGILYHVDHPLKELEYLYKVTNEFALIETAISYEVPNVPSVWQFLPGKENDINNKWYPTLSGLKSALLYVGFKKVEVIFFEEGNPRATVKAIK